jgi:hypothetical protein
LISYCEEDLDARTIEFENLLKAFSFKDMDDEDIEKIIKKSKEKWLKKNKAFKTKLKSKDENSENENSEDEKSEKDDSEDENSDEGVKYHLNNKRKWDLKQSGKLLIILIIIKDGLPFTVTY